MKREPPRIRTWTEVVDSDVAVGNATCFIVRAGYVYGLGVFILVDRNQFKDRTFGSIDIWKERRRCNALAEELLRWRVENIYDGELPPVGLLRNMDGASGIDMSW